MLTVAEDDGAGAHAPPSVSMCAADASLGSDRPGDAAAAPDEDADRKPPQGAAEPPRFENVLIKGRWQLKKQLGRGAFGEVYSALDISTNQSVAVKIEHPTAKKQVLKLEINLLRRLHAVSPYIPAFVACGKFVVTSRDSPSPPPEATDGSSHIYWYLVLDLLGPSLAEMRRKAPHGRFSIATAALLGLDMLRGIQSVHAVGYLHRDIKPANFCLRRAPCEPSKTPRLFLIDFGLARRFMFHDGTVRSARSKVGFRGTARYASLRAHQGKELGRVDDLWSLFFVLVEFLRGSLPWRGKEKERIGHLKQQHNTPALLAGCPPQMFEMQAYLQRVGFTDEPDYEFVAQCLAKMLAGTGRGLQSPYDWEVGTCEACVEPVHVSAPVAPVASPAVPAVPAPNLRISEHLAIPPPPPGLQPERGGSPGAPENMGAVTSAADSTVGQLAPMGPLGQIGPVVPMGPIGSLASIQMEKIPDAAARPAMNEVSQRRQAPATRPAVARPRPAMLVIRPPALMLPGRQPSPMDAMSPVAGPTSPFTTMRNNGDFVVVSPIEMSLKSGDRTLPDDLNATKQVTSDISASNLTNMSSSVPLSGMRRLSTGPWSGGPPAGPPVVPPANPSMGNAAGASLSSSRTAQPFSASSSSTAGVEKPRAVERDGDVCMKPASSLGGPRLPRQRVSSASGSGGTGGLSVGRTTTLCVPSNLTNMSGAAQHLSVNNPGTLTDALNSPTLTSPISPSMCESPSYAVPLEYSTAAHGHLHMHHHLQHHHAPPRHVYGIGRSGSSPPPPPSDASLIVDPLQKAVAPRPPPGLAPTLHVPDPRRRRFQPAAADSASPWGALSDAGD